VYTQPVPLTQLSEVHGLPSPHPTAWPEHVPLTHESFTVQELLSSQLPPVFGTYWHPLPAEFGEHVSSVQTLPSLHWMAPWPWQTPATQVSPLVQELPSLQIPPVFGW
jgi:hypothetical protein